jgi:predicted lipoprotein with Yx(FWY)xxD motif
MRRLLIVIAAGGLLVGCGNGDPAPPDDAIQPTVTTSAPMTSSIAPTSAPSAPTSSATTTSAEPGTIITSADSEFGEVLFDDTGQAIYLFDVETTLTPACYGECAVEWPPVLTDGAPVAAGAVASDLLGATMRADGTMQVTYGGHPLYFYAHEGKYEVLCHNFREFGGLWFAVAPTGDAAPI